MRPQKPMPPDSEERLLKLLKTTKNVSEFKRIQSVYLRAKYGYSSEQIAQMVGYHRDVVKRLQSQYLINGESALLAKNKGGRKREHMSLSEEETFLSEFVSLAKDGKIVEISQIHLAYEEKLGRKVGKSTVYAMLDRHRWRKVSPRPQHSKHNTHAAEEFKKTSHNW